MCVGRLAGGLAELEGGFHSSGWRTRKEGIDMEVNRMRYQGTELPTQHISRFLFCHKSFTRSFFYHINFMGTPPVCVSYFCSAWISPFV